MNNLADYLKKFSVILSTPQAQKKPILERLQARGIALSDKNIEIRDRIAYISSHPTVKSEIFMRKSSLLKEININLDASCSIRDIR